MFQFFCNGIIKVVPSTYPQGWWLIGIAHYGTLGLQKVMGSNLVMCRWNSYWPFTIELDLGVPIACQFKFIIVFQKNKNKNGASPKKKTFSSPPNQLIETTRYPHCANIALHLNVGWDCWTWLKLILKLISPYFSYYKSRGQCFKNLIKSKIIEIHLGNKDVVLMHFHTHH